MFCVLTKDSSPTNFEPNNSEIRGIYNYYCIANNVSILNSFYQIMKESMYKTFSSKYNSTVRKIINSYTRDKIFRVQYEDNKGRKHERELYHGGFDRRKDARIDDADNLPSYRGMPIYNDSVKIEVVQPWLSR